MMDDDGNGLAGDMAKRPDVKTKKSLIDLVQDHERVWGAKSYPGRPTLAELLQAPVAAWWNKPNDDATPMMASVHDDLDMLSKYAARMLLQTRAAGPDQRLVMVFLNQKKAAIRGVRLDVIPLDEPATYLNIVQSHEREWGTRSYSGRPTLAELLQAPVAAWWNRRNDDRPMMASVHDDLDMLNKYAARMLLQTRAAVPERRLAMVFLNQKKAAIRGVRLDVIPLPD